MRFGITYIRAHRLERPVLVGHSLGAFLAYGVRRLLRSGEDPNGAATAKYPPIFDAIEQGNYSLTRLLVEHGADVNRLWLYAGGTTTPLGLAASLGHIGLVRFLLASGADPAREVAGGDLLVGLSRREPGANARRIVSTILRSVEAKKGHAAMVALAERRSSDGWTPLAHAAFVGDLDVLQELLDHGASARGEKEAQSPPGDEDRPAGQ